jgi:hypothetical protein
MRNSSARLLFLAVLLAAFAVLARTSYAQTTPDLLVKPWEDGQSIDTSSEGTFEAAGHTRETDQTIRLSEIHEFGRWRILPDNPATPRIGYDMLYYDLQAHDPALPRHLFDTSIGFAQPIHEFTNKWFAVVTGAVGYAGNSLFSDPHAVYAKGDIIVGRQWGPNHAILVALDYDGNRTLMPDTPIPGIAYTNRYNPQLTYVIGFPYSSITYEPLSGFQLEAGYTLLSTFEAKIGYEFIKHFSIFTDYSDRLTPFHLDTLPTDRRLFLQTHEVEIGLRWNPTKTIGLSVGGGWAFGQEISRGFDDRNLTPIRHISDAPFARLLVEIGF